MFTNMPKPGGSALGESEPALLQPRRCTKRSKDGSQCKKAPIRGGTVCHMHGGGAPHVREKANQVLLQARDHAAAVLRDVMEAYQRDPCEKCGYSLQDPSPAIRAAIAVLDRTGFGPTASLKLSHDGAAPWTAWSTNEELQQAQALKDAAIARMEAGDQPFGEVREFDIPEHEKLVWLPKHERSSLPAADETIEAVVMDTQPEAE